MGRRHAPARGVRPSMQLATPPRRRFSGINSTRGPCARCVLQHRPPQCRACAVRVQRVIRLIIMSTYTSKDSPRRRAHCLHHAMQLRPVGCGLRASYQAAHAAHCDRRAESARARRGHTATAARVHAGSSETVSLRVLRPGKLAHCSRGPLSGAVRIIPRKGAGMVSRKKGGPGPSAPIRRYSCWRSEVADLDTQLEAAGVLVSATVVSATGLKTRHET